jgi:hypothetical protein
MDTAKKGLRWTIYNDPLLDSLQSQVDISTQTVKEPEAQSRQALALVKEAQSGLYRTVGVVGAIFQTGAGVGTTVNDNILEGSANWTRDMGTGAAGDRDRSLRRPSQRHRTRLSAAFRASDPRRRFAGRGFTVAGLAGNRRRLPARADDHAEPVSSAHRVRQRCRDGVDSATIGGGSACRCRGHPRESQTRDRSLNRVSTGRLVPTFSPLPKDVPVFPPGLPSTSLERRSDVASAKSAMRDENAQTGIELAIYNPTISLPAAGLSALVQAGQFGLVRRVG